MKKERFDFIAMLMSLFLLSAFVIEEQVKGTIAGTVSKTYRAKKVRAIKAREAIESKIISNSLLINPGSSFKKDVIFDLKFRNAEAKNGGEIRLVQR
ncbi:hypothetical protein WG954_17090 [Lacibacter sp. H375]|uniref:hypothetical protein n=1 Tax=Lacibacter sp. H375 TaxID=3133424 RepID=UPI0030C289E8